MSNVAILFSKPAGAGAADDYLGPARVVASRAPGASGVSVELPDGAAVTAQMALAFPYEPALDDVLLVIGKGSAHYVIGVLHGAGRSMLALQGDVEIRAVGGSLTLAGDTGLCLESPELSIATGKLRMVAESIVQKFTHAYQHVREVLSVRAGESHTVVDGSSFSRAKSGVILTEEKMAINGKEIHLG